MTSNSQVKQFAEELSDIYMRIEDCNGMTRRHV